MAQTKDELLREITQEYLDSIDVTNPPLPSVIQAEIIEMSTVRIQMENQLRAKGTQWRIPTRLAPAQIADILVKLHHVVNIAYGGFDESSEYDVLSVYQTDGEDEGIYTSSKQMFYKLIRQYGYLLSDKEINETITLLKQMVPRVIRCSEINLLAVNNGIFDYDTKQLMPFSPEYVFVSKSRVNYNPNAQNPVIHNDDDNTDWDIESWMDDLFDGNKNMSTLMWEIIGAIIRPNVPWNKSAWFYSNTGNNGKGTLCELMRQIAGHGTYASIQLSDFSKDFTLEPLINASCIIVDENDVGTYIDKAANLKAIITNDVIQINRKFKTPIAYQFKGFMVQCLNELPKIKDRTESFYRRQLFVPFEKCFTGAERKYIKNDYLHRTEVLEYVLAKILNTKYYSLSEPDECKAILNEYKEYNDPIRQFIEEIIPECKWDLLPYPFLYDLYKEWFKKVSPTGTVLGKNTFIQEINRLIKDSTEWYAVPGNNKIRPGTKMNKSEPLIAEYNLTDWMNPLFKGKDIEKMCHPLLKENYRGILRKI